MAKIKPAMKDFPPFWKKYLLARNLENCREKKSKKRILPG
jgi:hypothetical protein